MLCRQINYCFLYYKNSNSDGLTGYHASRSDLIVILKFSFKNMSCYLSLWFLLTDILNNSP